MQVLLPLKKQVFEYIQISNINFALLNISIIESRIDYLKGNTHIDIYIHTYTDTQSYTHTRTYTYMYTQTHTYINTHTHTQTHK